MGQKELEQRLAGTLKKLEDSANNVIKTRGYTKDVEKIRILEELIREQIKNENSSYSAC